MAPLGLVATLGCRAPQTACDERALDQAITRFEADPGAEDAPLELVEAMSSACPDFPDVLIDSLAYTYARDHTDEQLRTLLDERYLWARRMTCLNPHRWAAIGSAPADQRAEATYSICNLERLGLLEADEPFLFEDFPAMVAQRWMLQHHVDPALSRRFNRSLMIATASEPLSRSRCHAHPDSFACQKLMRSHGSGLPASSARGGQLDHDTRLFTTPTWRAVGDQREIAEVSTLDDLNDRLARGSEDTVGGELLLFADRQTSWADLIELMRIAYGHGYRTFSLATAGVGENEHLPVAPPPVWSMTEWSETNGVGAPVLVIEADGVRLPDGGTVSLTDVALLEGIARELLGSSRDMSLVVRARADVELQTVVTVLDALRGRGCTLDPQLEPNEDCVVWLPRIDLDPPTPRRPGDWSQLRLSIPDKAKAWDNRKGPASLKELHTRVEQALEPIRQCLIESGDARMYMPERTMLIFGLDEDDQLSMNVFGPFNDWLPSDCISHALHIPLLDVRVLTASTAFADVEVLIDVPG